MTNTEDKYYIPSKIQIGKGNVNFRNNSYYSSYTDSIRIKEISIPSCRFKLENWTDMDTFEGITGFRPSNMADKSKEITKMLTGNVFEVDNVPTRGFKLVDNYRFDMYSKNGYGYGYNVAIEDPRDFIIQMPLEDFMKLILDNHVSIDKDGVIGDEFIYMWNEDPIHKNKAYGFELISTSDERYVNKGNIVTEEQIMEARIKNPGIKSKDLVPGKVYDYDNGGRISRLLFLGKLDMIPKKPTRDFLESSYVTRNYELIESIKSELNGVGSCYDYMYYGDMSPWKSETWTELMSIEPWKPNTSQNVFLILHEQKYRNTNDLWDFSLDYIANGNEDDNTINMIDNITVMSGGRKIRGESEDQRIKILDEPRSWSGRITNDNKCFEYKEYCFDQVKDAYLKSQEMLSSMMRRYKYICPPEKPYGISTMDWKREFLKCVEDENYFPFWGHD